MSYIACRFDASAADAEAWSDALLEAGALSVDVSDPLAGTADESPLYGEPGETAARRWDWSRVVALFADDADWRSVVHATAATLALPVPPCESFPVADQDWVRQTQAQFGPIEVAPGFWIVPSWSAVPVPGALCLRLDPGLAFGTGSHPTTRLCLEWLHETVTDGEAVLDYGCGSGILAIAAAKLGARMAPPSGAARRSPQGASALGRPGGVRIPPNGAARRSPQGASALGRPGGVRIPPNGAARRSPQGASALGRPGGA